MTGFVSPLGDLTGKVFVTDSWLIDRYIGSTLWTCGQGTSGQLGDNSAIGKSSPVQTVDRSITWKQVSCGYNLMSAIKTDGTLWTWGNNAAGQLGDNTVANKSSPVQTATGGTDWKQHTVGNRTVLAVKTDGTLWGWGQNGYGQLGDNTVAHKSSPVQTVAGGANWKQVSMGKTTASAIKTDGTLWIWGEGTLGLLGDNTVAHKSSPVQTVAAGTNWKQVSVGVTGAAAIKTDGTLWLWGANSTGQLGDNTVAHKSSPVQTVATGTNWKQVSMGGATGAIKTDNTLWVWGDNPLGLLGDNTIAAKSSPVQTVAAGAAWKQINMSQFNASAIKYDGTLWTWGDNSGGQLGINSLVHVSSPVQTLAGGANWKQANTGMSGKLLSAVTFN